jgi:hypothetical protein
LAPRTLSLPSRTFGRIHREQVHGGRDDEADDPRAGQHHGAEPPKEDVALDRHRREQGRRGREEPGALPRRSHQGEADHRRCIDGKQLEHLAVLSADHRRVYVERQPTDEYQAEPLQDGLHSRCPRVRAAVQEREEHRTHEGDQHRDRCHRREHPGGGAHDSPAMRWARAFHQAAT